MLLLSWSDSTIRLTTQGKKATIVNFIPGKNSKTEQKIMHQYAKHPHDVGFTEVGKLMISTGEKSVVVIQVGNETGSVSSLPKTTFIRVYSGA